MTNGLPSRVRNRWGEGDRLRVEILEAATRLLSELGGVDGLTIRGVARAVGIAPASIYEHFADRSALVAGLLEHEFARLGELMEAADGKADPADVVGRLRAQAHAYCAFALENPGHYRLMLTAGASRPGPDGRPRGPMVDLIGSLTAAFARCEEAGHRLRLPGDRAAAMVIVCAHGRVALMHNNPSLSSVDAATAFVDELIALVFA